MVEVRLLVPVTDNNGKEHPAGEVIDVEVDTAEAWRAMGKVSLITTEEANAAAAAQGHYTDVTGRDDVAPLDTTEQTPGPQAAEDDDDEEERPRGKRRR